MPSACAPATRSLRAWRRSAAAALALLAAACAGSSGLQCVPYARERSGIAIRGDAWTWWDQAQNHYARGNRPLPGSVLVFKRTSALPEGHVAVVKSVLASDRILVDQANWGGYEGAKGRITENVVVDVSGRNDWTAVRVASGPPGALSRPYTTYGFIYPRGKPM